MTRSVHDYFQKALQRPRSLLQPEKFEEDTGRNRAAFRVLLQDGRITSVEYSCTTCCTLVALCEHLREMVVGMTKDMAVSMTADALVKLHPEIPAGQRERADLAVRALQVAVYQQRKEITG